MVLPHIDVEAAWAGNLLQLALWTRGAAQVVQTSHNTQHRGQRDPAGVAAQTGVGAYTIMDVRFQGTVKAYFVRVGEDVRLSCGAHLCRLCKHN